MPDAPTPPPAVPFLFLAVAAVMAFALGDAAQDLARWFVCLSSPAPCSPHSKAEAETIATMVSTFVAVFLASQAGRSGRASGNEARLLVVGAMTGAFFAVLKATEGANGYPELLAFQRPLIVWAVALPVFLVPMWQTPPGREDWLWALYQRLALAFLVAACLGALLQGVAHALWTVAHDNDSARKFVVAPAAPVIAGAVFGVLMLADGGTARRPTMALFWAGIAMAGVALWNLAGHGPGPGRFGAAHGLLVLSGVLLMAGLCCVGRPLQPSAPTLVLVGAACVVAAALGAYLGLARVGQGRLSSGDVPVLALVQGMGPALVWLSVALAFRLQARLARTALPR